MRVYLESEDRVIVTRDVAFKKGFEAVSEASTGSEDDKQKYKETRGRPRKVQNQRRRKLLVHTFQQSPKYNCLLLHLQAVIMIK